jgi:hypothetical protein
MNDKQKKRLEAQLDERQRLAALLCVQREFTPEADRLGFEEISEQIGVSRQTLFKWRHENDAFIEYSRALANTHLTSKFSVVYGQLMKLIEGSNPSVKAIDLFLRKYGELREVVETVDSGSIGGTDRDSLARDIADLDDLLGGGGN